MISLNASLYDNTGKKSFAEIRISNEQFEIILSQMNRIHCCQWMDVINVKVEINENILTIKMSNNEHFRMKFSNQKFLHSFLNLFCLIQKTVHCHYSSNTPNLIEYY